jgi:hypothetical protein
MKPDEYWKILENRPLFYKQKIPALIGFESQTKLDEVGQTIKKLIEKKGSVLEIGSGNNALQKKIRDAGYQGIFHTMDIETKFPHDFHSLDEIKERYDVILMLELIEHMPLDFFFSYLDFVEKHLKSEGTLVISTPNTAHLNQIWKGDMTHMRPFPLRDLFSLLTARDYSTQMYKVHLIEENYGILRWIRRRLAQLIAWILYAEIYEGVIIFATRSSAANLKNKTETR